MLTRLEQQAPSALELQTRPIKDNTTRLVPRFSGHTAHETLIKGHKTLTSGHTASTKHIVAFALRTARFFNSTTVDCLPGTLHWCWTNTLHGCWTKPLRKSLGFVHPSSSKRQTGAIAFAWKTVPECSRKHQCLRQLIEQEVALVEDLQQLFHEWPTLLEKTAVPPYTHEVHLFASALWQLHQLLGLVSMVV